MHKLQEIYHDIFAEGATLGRAFMPLSPSGAFGRVLRKESCDYRFITPPAFGEVAMGLRVAF